MSARTVEVAALHRYGTRVMPILGSRFGKSRTNCAFFFAGCINDLLPHIINITTGQVLGACCLLVNASLAPCFSGHAGWEGSASATASERREAGGGYAGGVAFFYDVQGWHALSGTLGLR